jgi:hypothetical protein
MAPAAIETEVFQLTPVGKRGGLYRWAKAVGARLIGQQLLLECILVDVGVHPSGSELVLQNLCQGDSPRRVKAIAVVAEPVPARRADIRRDRDAIGG